MSDQTFLVGSGGKTIPACRLTSNGQLQFLLESKSGKAPSWLLAQNDFLYAVNEEDDKIETFTIDDRIEGKLTSKTIISSKGNTPCSLDIDPSGKWLAVAK
jgi:6-phosphogluconolactonase (cycloisomerase 2 family)